MLTANQDQLVTRFAVPAREFFEHLRFSATPAPVVTQPAAADPRPRQHFMAIPPSGPDGGAPLGLFYRLQAGSGSSTMETRTRTFLPGNRIIRFDPAGGGNAIDLARCSPDTCGAYRIEGAWLTVRWDNGETQRLSFSSSGRSFTLDGQTFQPARGLEPGEVVGSWANPGGVSAGIEFKADHTFEWRAGSRETTLRGRYEVQGLSLVLHFADGTSREYALFAAGRTRPAGLISLDGTVYTRR
jgi:hypothetical protein